MTKRTRQLLCAGAVVVWSLLLFCAGAIWQPVWVQKLWIHIRPASRWEKLNALGRLIIPGMTPAEVQSILGSPAREDKSATKVTWMYRQEGMGGGNELYVTFFVQVGPAGHRSLYVQEVLQDHEFVTVGPVSKDYGRKYYRISVAWQPR
ncbi:MAG: hypothetical protein FJ290_05395 [Planctomycetes bacterium]|nr:hypothetical protein [Planctomycetota bacterium]